MAGLLIAAFALLGLCGLAVLERGQAKAAARQRAGLLDALAGEVAGEILDGRIAIRPDGFPALSGRLADGRAVELELVPDTLQVRRLPQLWLKLTIAERAPRLWPRIGALARPTGAEFYSLAAGFPRRILPPAGTGGAAEGALLVRGDAADTPAEIEGACAAFAALFRDSGLKEAAITPRGVRIVRQASEGDRGAHLLLRQARFPLAAVAPDLLRRALADAELLRAAHGGGAGARGAA